MRQLKLLVFTLLLCNVFVKEIDSLPSYASDQDYQTDKLPYVITEARLRDIRSQFMYWYSDTGGSNDLGDLQNTIHSHTTRVHKNLNFQLPFFGFRYNYTRISLHGYLEFSDPPQNYLGYPLVFPVQDWPKTNDPSFIGIFLSKCRLGALQEQDLDKRKPGVYFRLVQDLRVRTDKFGVEVRERVKWDIREGIIGAETFEPKHVIIATWKNVSFAGGVDQSLTTTNTFQVVLATDEVFTYAIFNYLDLQWTSHSEAMGDTLTGEGGIPAFVGFNAGNGTRSFQYNPYSQASVIRDLTRTGWGNGFKGRHIFRIDETIIQGSCKRDIDGANLPLDFAPESGNMLGGTVVNITGPCFQPGDRVICKFDNEVVDGTVINVNRAVCVQPKLSAAGYVRFEIAVVNDGERSRFKWKGKYFVETPESATQFIFFENDVVYEKYPSEIKILWNKSNLTIKDNGKVRISLWGYRELTNQPEFLYIDEIANNVENTGVYTISPWSYRERNNENITKVGFGFLQISLEEPIPNEGIVSKVIWSRPIPLGWYFAPQWELQVGKNWSEQLCSDWIQYDRHLKNFLDELPKCPCTLEQALADKGRYLPDPDCDTNSNPRCLFNVGAVHCVRTALPTLGGSEQQCCFDRNGFLMLSHDQRWGSIPSRSHKLGYQHFKEVNQVPSLSHWYHDVVPRFFCCLWQNEKSDDCEAFRTERRPTQDCVSYQGPEVAAVFGDPHIITFDNATYTFNGKGEFVLVRTNDLNNRLDIQARFEQMPENAYGEVRATQLTSIVARGNSSTVIEVRLRPPVAQWRYRLDVFANKERIYFDRPSIKFQNFPGVLVYTPTYILNQSEVIIMFDSGAGVEVIENHGYMTARVFLPASFTNQTKGLFGNFNFNKLDDFITPHGQQIAIASPDNDSRLIYEEFGMKWMLNDREDPDKGISHFVKEYYRSSAYYNNLTFKPEFKMLPEEILPPNRSYEINKAYDFCDEDIHCLYDHIMTGSKHFAGFTLMYKRSLLNLKETCKKKIISCGVLETPKLGRKSSFNFVPGTKVYFECDQGYHLVGDKTRECTSEGLWNAPEIGVTQCLPISN